MASYSFAEAQAQLPRLIDEALRGEAVEITRDGHPVVKLVPAERRREHEPGPGPLTQADVDWVVQRRVGRVSDEDAGSLVSRMRDESEH